MQQENRKNEVGELILLSQDELMNIIDVAVIKALNKFVQWQKQKSVFNKKEVAKILNIHPSTLSRWIKQGIIPNKPYYTYSDVLNFFQNK